MGRKKKNRQHESQPAAEQAPTRDERIEELRKAIIQEAILLAKRKQSSILNLCTATQAYLDEVAAQTGDVGPA